MKCCFLFCAQTLAFPAKQSKTTKLCVTCQLCNGCEAILRVLSRLCGKRLVVSHEALEGHKVVLRVGSATDLKLFFVSSVGLRETVVVSHKPRKGHKVCFMPCGRKAALQRNFKAFLCVLCAFVGNAFVGSHQALKATKLFYTMSTNLQWNS